MRAIAIGVLLPLASGVETRPQWWKTISGACESAGGCIRSPNYPQPYQDLGSCNIELASLQSPPLYASSFRTESDHDKLIINGVEYSGESGPQGIVATGGISWTSDFTGSFGGWEICASCQEDEYQTESGCGSCWSFMPGCVSCNGTDACTSCADSFVEEAVENGTFVNCSARLQCGVGEYYSIEGQCESCPPSCSPCSCPTQCTSCPEYGVSILSILANGSVACIEDPDWWDLEYDECDNYEGYFRDDRQQVLPWTIFSSIVAVVCIFAVSLPLCCGVAVKKAHLTPLALSVGIVAGLLMLVPGIAGAKIAGASYDDYCSNCPDCNRREGPSLYVGFGPLEGYASGFITVVLAATAQVLSCCVCGRCCRLRPPAAAPIGPAQASVAGAGAVGAHCVVVGTPCV